MSAPHHGTGTDRMTFRPRAGRRVADARVLGPLARAVLAERLEPGDAVSVPRPRARRSPDLVIDRFEAGTVSCHIT